MTPESQKYLCTALLNGISTDLYAVKDELSGWFYYHPEPKGRPRIKVGTKHEQWWQCLAVLMHETQEAVAGMMCLRFRPSDDYSNENGLYSFHMDHSQFAEMVAASADFLAVAVPKLAAEWQRRHRKAK